MNTRLFGIMLLTLTAIAVFYYPVLSAESRHPVSGTERHDVAQRPVVDVVFVLDTTGSMSGLIQTAKEKIWSIASTMASAQQTPEIRIGLVGYRDRGDEYVTRVVDLDADLDSVYAALMDFQALMAERQPGMPNCLLSMLSSPRTFFRRRFWSSLS